MQSLEVRTIASEGLVRRMRLSKIVVVVIKRFLQRMRNNIVILEGPDEFTY